MDGSQYKMKQLWFIWPVLVVVGFIASIAVMGVVSQLLLMAGVRLQLEGTLSLLIQSILIYVLTLATVLYLAKLVRQPPTRQEMGLRWLTWNDIGIALASFVVYVIVGTIVLQVIQLLFPGLPMDKPQDIGFDKVFGLDRAVAFVVLVIVAPVVEELIFRGLLYGKMRSVGLNIAVSVFVTSVLFAVAHGQLNVGIDVFILSVILCIVRETTRGVGSPILIHMMKNGAAFYTRF